MGFESFPQPAQKPAQAVSRSPLERQKATSSVERDRETVREEMTRWINARSREIDERSLRMMKPEVREYYEREGLTIDQFAYRSFDIQFIGVAHDSKNLAVHRQAIEAAIQAADMVVYEGGVAGDGGVEAEVVLDDTVTEIQSGHLTAKMRLPENVTKPYKTFFYEVVSMAKKYGKQAITLDPISDHRFMKSAVEDGGAYIKSGKDLNRKIEHRSYNAIALGKVATLLGGGAVAFELARGAIEQSKMSRRNFLRVGAAAVTASAGGMLVHGANKNLEAIYDQDVNGKNEKWSQYNLTDYRDVAVAEGIDQLSRKVSPGKKLKVAVVYGKGHRSGVRYYLENPMVRSAKQKAYQPFVEVAPPEINAYRYDVRSNVPPVRKGEVIEDTRWGEWTRTLHVAQPWQEQTPQ